MNRESLRRLLAPKTLALVGGNWTDAVANACRQIGYQGKIWRIHPTRPSDETTTYYRSIDELPGAPDASFLAAPAADIPALAEGLSRRGAGGFVCFASGFDETATDEGRKLTADLVTAAGDLAFTGPNCYGLVNFFDRAALWPDQVVGGARSDRGVAILCQSGTISLTLMFNQRDLPIGYVISVGNQTRLALEDLIEVLSEDPRVTAFGLYIEGIKDAGRFSEAVNTARAAGKPIALVKSGRTAAAAQAAATHTGAMAGADAVFDAYCRDAGIARCDTLASLVETLKVLHSGGPLNGHKVLVMGASGGDMAMTSDVARHTSLEFPPLPADIRDAVQEAVGPRVTIANPFDFHTYIWFNQPKMQALFSSVFKAGYDAVAFMLDCPPADRSDTSAFDGPIRLFVEEARKAGARAAMLASLPETLYEDIRSHCMQHGVIPLQGQREGLEALNAAANIGTRWRDAPPVTLQRPRAGHARTRTLREDEGKAALSAHGLPVPMARTVSIAEAAAAADAIGFPVVIKAASADLAHKSDVGGVALNIRSAAEATATAERLAALSDTVLVEQMVVDGVAEILVGLTVDPQFGQVLVLGAGGVLTEYLHDSTSLLPPFTEAAIRQGLQRLNVLRLLKGFRGKPAGDVDALVQAILAVARYAEAHVDSLVELDVNPIIVRPQGRGVVAVDALIRIAE
jgi:acetyl-CoA synthetase